MAKIKKIISTNSTPVKRRGVHPCLVHVGDILCERVSNISNGDVAREAIRWSNRGRSFRWSLWQLYIPVFLILIYGCSSGPKQTEQRRRQEMIKMLYEDQRSKAILNYEIGIIEKQKRDKEELEGRE